MCDEDVIRRAHEIAGVGHVYKGALTTGGKRVWIWRVLRYEDTGPLLKRMLPHLGERRSRTAHDALNAWKENPPRRLRTHCKRGHPFSGDNLRVHTDSKGQRRRQCRTCLNATNRARYHAQKA